MASKPFPVLKNDLLLRAARGEEVPHTPVWMMRQAGRYLPEYHTVREGHTFFETCRSPDLVTEITIQPTRRFPIDAAIIFSDILVIPQAMGLEVQMVPGRGPVLPEPLAGPADLKRLIKTDVSESLHYVFEAITQTRHALDGRVPLIGFAGAPWTLMAYMIEGGGSKSCDKARAWLFAEPGPSQKLLDDITEMVIAYLSRQIEAGAQFIQIFDSWAGVLAPEQFARYSLPTLRRIAAALRSDYPEIPLAVFARGAHYALEDLADSAFDVVSIDWTVDPVTARRIVGDRVTLQGNLDPATLFASPDVIRRAVRSMIDAFGANRYIANLGHGMLPAHRPEHAGVFVDAVHEISSTTKAA